MGPLMETMRRILGSSFNAELESVYTRVLQLRGRRSGPRVRRQAEYATAVSVERRTAFLECKSHRIEEFSDCIR